MAKHRTTANETPETITFRPQRDLEGDFAMIHEWCKKNGSSVNSVFNSFLPAIAYAIQSDMFHDDEGKRFIRSDFGDVLLREPNHNCA